MSKVMILGAGASVHANGPTMDDFLDVAERVRREADLQEEQERAFETVFTAEHLLRPAQARIRIALQNIEDLFSALEMADLLSLDLGATTMPTADAMRVLITTTLLERMKLGVTGTRENRRFAPPVAYFKLAEEIGEAAKKGIEPPVIITFNYDVALDYALSVYGHEVRYGFEDRGAPLDGLMTSGLCSVHLFKLHGSLNWYCDSQGDLHAVDVAQLVRESAPRNLSRIKRFRIPLERGLKDAGGDSTTPLVVPPTWSKFSGYDALRRVWVEAAEALRRAETLAFVGYSLPKSDQFLPPLLALGTMGQARLKNILVSNPDRSAHARVAELLGEEARSRLSRPDLEPFSGSGTLGAFVRRRL